MDKIDVLMELYPGIEMEKMLKISKTIIELEKKGEEIIAEVVKHTDILPENTRNLIETYYALKNDLIKAKKEVGGKVK